MIYNLQKRDMSKVGPVLADAFQHDPLWTTILKGEATKNAKWQAVFETPVRYCMKYGGVYGVSQDLAGVAAFAPSEFADMKLWRVIRSRAIFPGLKIGFQHGGKMMKFLSPLEKDRKAHMKGKSHIYLLVIGVATKSQGKGLGGELIKAVIKTSEEKGVPLYLETETESNVKLYEKFGFRVIKEVRLPEIQLPMWEMVREN